jgi:tRNA pseudouridine-54 N-methylase
MSIVKKGVFCGVKRAEFRLADEIGSCQRLAVICCIVVNVVKQLLFRDVV